MAHAKLNLSSMLDWIERNIEHDVAQPTDAQIMGRFGFDNPESARTLLAELADAGRITIKGYGATRTITLGRTKTALAPAPRPLPAAKRADPAIDAGVAKIAAIVARGGNAGSARAAQADAAMKAASTKSAPAPAPRPSNAPTPRPVAVATVKEPAPMPAKTICLPASAVTAIDAIERLSAKNGITIGGAAVLLIEQALAPASNVEPERESLTIASVMSDLDTLLQCLRRQASRPDQSSELAAAVERATDAEARAIAAEAALARIKAALAS